jgi:paraquat-inducible protein B
MAGKRTNPTLVGLFIVGAMALLISGLVMYGSGRFFSSDKRTFVLFFNENVQGLNVGAPVTFKGVKIGSVTDVQLVFNSEDLSIQIPVFIEIDGRTIKEVNEKTLKEKTTIEDDNQYYTHLIELGLRGQLTTQSLVTGQLMIQFDFYPKALKYQPHNIKLITNYPELPTISSTIEELSKSLEKLPIEALVNKVISAVDGIEKLVTKPELAEGITVAGKTLENTQRLIEDVQTLVQHVDQEIKPLIENVNATVGDYKKMATTIEGFSKNADQLIKDLNKTSQDISRLVNNVNKQVEPVSTKAQASMDKIASALTEAEKTLATIQTTVNDKSTLRYEINETLKELSSAARSIRELADFLKRHPESLVYGKGKN